MLVAYKYMYSAISTLKLSALNFTFFSHCCSGVEMELISEWGSRSEGQELRSRSRTDFSELLRDNYNFAKSDTKFAIIPLLSAHLYSLKILF